MKQPQEIEVWYILPSLRKEIAKELVRLGMKQKEVASLLDITESAISQYFKSKRGKDIPLTKKIKDKIKISAKRIYHNKESFTKELQDLCKLVKEENILCQVHKKYDNISAKCNICFKDISLNLKPIKQNKSHHDCPICDTLYKIKLTNCPKCGFITGSRI